MPYPPIGPVASLGQHILIQYVTGNVFLIMWSALILFQLEEVVKRMPNNQFSAAQK